MLHMLENAGMILTFQRTQPWENLSGATTLLVEFFFNSPKNDTDIQ
jgi:hypothetical protein